MIQFQTCSHCSAPIVIPPCNQLQGCGSAPSQLSPPVQSCQVPTGLGSVFHLTRLHTSPTLHHCTLTFGRYPDLTLEKESKLFYLSVSLVHGYHFWSSHNEFQETQWGRENQAQALHGPQRERSKPRVPRGWGEAWEAQGQVGLTQH